MGLDMYGQHSSCCPATLLFNTNGNRQPQRSGALFWRGPALHVEKVCDSKYLLVSCGHSCPIQSVLHTIVRGIFSSPDGITSCPAEDSLMVLTALRIKSGKLTGLRVPPLWCFLPLSHTTPLAFSIQTATHSHPSGPSTHNDLCHEHFRSTSLCSVQTSAFQTFQTRAPCHHPPARNAFPSEPSFHCFSRNARLSCGTADTSLPHTTTLHEGLLCLLLLTSEPETSHEQGSPASALLTLWVR